MTLVDLLCCFPPQNGAFRCIVVSAAITDVRHCVSSRLPLLLLMLEQRMRYENNEASERDAMSVNRSVELRSNESKNAASSVKVFVVCCTKRSSAADESE
jgi:hypothetical protein